MRSARPSSFSGGSPSSAVRSRRRGPLYLLPYSVGASYSVLQGYNGEWGHESAAAYAYDFKMPIGSPLTVAREGWW